MTERTEQFVARFNELEQYLRDSSRSRRNVPFGELVSRAGEHNAAARHHARDLREWSDLRNAIVHEHPKGKVIAEVTPEALAEFDAIVSQITAPPPVFPLFRRDVRVFRESDPLLEAVEDLWREGYSQVIVRRDGALTLLSYAGVARWLGAALNGSSIDLSGATVGDALTQEEPGGIAFLPRDASVFQARELFVRLPQRQTQRLRVIVVTEHGDPSETPLGLITASDLLEIDQDDAPEPS